MKCFEYNCPNNAQLLMQELDIAFPQYRGTEVQSGKWKDPTMRLDIMGDDVFIYVPEDADESAFNAIIAEHNPSGTTEYQQRRAGSEVDKAKIRNANDNVSAKMGDLKMLVRAIGADWIYD